MQCDFFLKSYLSNKHVSFSWCSYFSQNSQLDLEKVSSEPFPSSVYHQVLPVTLSPPSAPSLGSYSLVPLICFRMYSISPFNPSEINTWMCNVLCSYKCAFGTFSYFSFILKNTRAWWSRQGNTIYTLQEMRENTQRVKVARPLPLGSLYLDGQCICLSLPVLSLPCLPQCPELCKPTAQGTFLPRYPTDTLNSPRPKLQASFPLLNLFLS